MKAGQLRRITQHSLETFDSPKQKMSARQALVRFPDCLKKSQGTQKTSSARKGNYSYILHCYIILQFFSLSKMGMFKYVNASMQRPSGRVGNALHMEHWMHYITLDALYHIGCTTFHLLRYTTLDAVYYIELHWTQCRWNRLISLALLRPLPCQPTSISSFNKCNQICCKTTQN